MTDSPVSIMANEAETFPVFDPADDPHNQPKSDSEGEGRAQEPSTAAVNNQVEPVPSSPDQMVKEPVSPEPAKKEKDKQKRFTIQAVLFGVGNEGQEKKLKKLRRQTMPLPISTTAEGANPEMKGLAVSPEEEKAAGLPNDDFIAHPAVRPLSLMIPSDIKGKEKDTLSISSAPVYHRCACCGKVKRPHGYNSELSPVLENENLRTNFSFEVDRMSTSRPRRSSDASRDKFTPIIPMQIGENITRQARIEPYTKPSVETPEPRDRAEETGMIIAESSPVRQPIRQMTASPIKAKRNSAPPRFVRFASLHGRRSEDTGPIAEEEEEEVEGDENWPLMMEQGEYRNSSMEVAEMSGAVSPEEEKVIEQPLPEISSAARAVVKPLPTIAMHYAELVNPGPADALTYRPSNRSSSSMEFHTPETEPTPVLWDSAISAPVEHVNDPSILLPETGTSFVQQSDLSEEAREEPSRASSSEETPTSTTSTATTVTIITPTSPSTDPTSLSNPSAFEKELSASFLAGGSGMDLSLHPPPTLDSSLRPKFSFETVVSAIQVEPQQQQVSEKGVGNGQEKVTPTGKRRSLASTVMGDLAVNT